MDNTGQLFCSHFGGSKPSERTRLLTSLDGRVWRNGGSRKSNSCSESIPASFHSLLWTSFISQPVRKDKTSLPLLPMGASNVSKNSGLALQCCYPLFPSESGRQPAGVPLAHSGSHFFPPQHFAFVSAEESCLCPHSHKERGSKVH